MLRDMSVPSALWHLVSFVVLLFFCAHTHIYICVYIYKYKPWWRGRLQKICHDLSQKSSNEVWAACCETKAQARFLTENGMLHSRSVSYFGSSMVIQGWTWWWVVERPVPERTSEMVKTQDSVEPQNFVVPSSQTNYTRFIQTWDSQFWPISEFPWILSTPSIGRH